MYFIICWNWDSLEADGGQRYLLSIKVTIPGRDPFPVQEADAASSTSVEEVTQFTCIHWLCIIGMGLVHGISPRLELT